MEKEIFSQNSKEVKSIKLDPKVWSYEFSPQLISLYNRYSLFNNRQTISKTKTKGEVSGGGRKPWKQKGTGRARQGSIRSPQWRGGGVVFGPTGEQRYTIELNKKVKKSALSSLLSKKMSEKEILIVDELNLKNYKTKDALFFLKNLNLEEKKVLIVLSYPNELSLQVRKSFDNLSKVTLTSASQINVSKILSSHFVLFTKEAIFEMEKRLTN
ncbi:MAG: 50S ribosomal protein L4 [Mycoplasmataceae bacterium]|nr:MAG: 50S ribosomal protein L4 [Mycoplasmataceae bacterium]